MGKRKTYSREFKQKAIRLVLEEDRPATQVTMELGIGANILYHWNFKYLGDNLEAFPGRAKLSKDNEYIHQLERENKRLKEERYILKKATIFFAGEP